MSQTTRILDRASYPYKTIETYEMIAAYYVDIFYNHLYFEAKKMRNDGSVSSITEGYKHTLNAFLQGVEDPKLYKKSLLGMHTYFIDNGFRNMTFSQYIERVISEFIPGDFAESIANKQRSAILRTVLNNVTQNFVYKIVSSYLGIIIDQHNDVDNVRLLQDELIDLLLIERNSMFKRFIGGSTKRKGVDISILEDMQKEIKQHLVEKYQLKKTITDLKKIVILKEQRHRQDLSKIEELTNTINELRSELQMPKITPNNGSTVEDYSSPEVIEMDNTIDEILAGEKAQNLDHAEQAQIQYHEQTQERTQDQEQTQKVQIQDQEDKEDDESYFTINANEDNLKSDLFDSNMVWED